MRHLIDPMDLSVEEVDHLLVLAQDIIDNKEKYSEVCKGKKLGRYRQDRQLLCRYYSYETL